MKCPECSSQSDSDSVYCEQCSARIVPIDSSSKYFSWFHSRPRWAKLLAAAILLIILLYGGPWLQDVIHQHTLAEIKRIEARSSVRELEWAAQKQKIKKEEALELRQRQEEAVNRMHPNAFKNIPQDVIAKLNAKGCRVPQFTLNEDIPGPNNVIRGMFAQPGQTDWAALCSRNGFSSIFVIWGGPKQCTSEFEKYEDVRFVSCYGENEFRFSRLISVPKKDEISDYFGKLTVDHEPIGHEGQLYSFGQGWTAYYCHEGRWIGSTFDDLMNELKGRL